MVWYFVLDIKECVYGWCFLLIDNGIVSVFVYFVVWCLCGLVENWYSDEVMF